ncbi:MAG: phosphoenolpyruvate--protein phosphotransferase [Treponema sp.]|jgi:phosphotransferase system enzyme I (PtsI)|nr:phosphoenolpyruvate--protein phosphotransferase [Treponema sp.]
MIKFIGIPASPGIVIGNTFLYLENENNEIPRYSIKKNQVESEWKRLLLAFKEAAEEIRGLREKAELEISKEQAAIFAAHLLMLEDEELLSEIQVRLKAECQNIEWVFWNITHELSQKLIAAADPYLRERAVDIADISRRVLNILLKIKKFSLADLNRDVILAVHDLLPSDTLLMNKKRVKGLVMDVGGRTSHTAILARAFDIPAVLGLSSITREIQDGEKIVMDGTSGEVIIAPDRAVLKRYENAIGQYKKMVAGFSSIRELPSETTDGYRVTLMANIEIPEEAGHVLDYGAEGIGLYRSEFLFISPGKIAEEEEQYRAYSKVLKAMGDLPVTIRTVDVGGDKIIPELQNMNEKNPLLGWRAVRFSLAHSDIFKIQLRAILRSSLEGRARVMFPMISGIEELETALSLWEEAKAECRTQEQAFADNIPVGTMIEIPSAAMTADILAEKSDFFSIGTNDLIQYSIAVDRSNEKVNYLAQPTHPAVLRLLKMSIDAAHRGGIQAAMCGEMAGDAALSPLLLGLGLDIFSMGSLAIPAVKRVIRSASIESCRTLAEEALKCRYTKEVNALLEEWQREHEGGKAE